MTITDSNCLANRPFKFFAFLHAKARLGNFDAIHRFDYFSFALRKQHLDLIHEIFQQLELAFGIQTIIVTSPRSSDLHVPLRNSLKKQATEKEINNITE
jgi:hypothetical protein